MTRYEFIRAAGIAAATLVLGRGAYSGVYATTPRGKLRRCWLRLAEVYKEETQEETKEMLTEIEQDHSEALDELVACGKLNETVAKQIGQAFDVALGYVWDTHSMIMCYFAGPPIGALRTPGLMKQAKVLGEIAWMWPLAPEIVIRAQANIERDIAAMNETSKNAREASDFLVNILLER